MTLGQLIGTVRKANPRFKTKKSLADAVDVSLEYIRKIEADQGKPSGKLLERIIYELDMSKKEATQCWEYLAELQIDAITLQHVRIAEIRLDMANGIAGKAAKAAAQWVEDYYDISPEDAEILESEIIKSLRK